MAQQTGGIFSVLSVASIYSLLQTLLGANKARRVIVEDYLRPRAGEAVLDIGCGPAEILTFFPQVDYHGFDLNPAYIHKAREHYEGRGKFYCKDVTQITPGELPEFDLIILISLLHHLDDGEVVKLFKTLAVRLKKGGRLVSVDPCRIERQHPIARFMIENDRGRNIRSPEEYQELARKCFGQVEAAVRSDLLNIPYNHTILSCRVA